MVFKRLRKKIRSFNIIQYRNYDHPFSDIKKLKKVFKPLTWCFWCGKTKKAPIIGFPVTAPIDVQISSVWWKDKFNSPRYEDTPPYIMISLFGVSFLWRYVFPWGWNASGHFVSDYWEQVLWYLYYSDCDLDKAKETWPWQDMKGNTTWNDFFVKQ